MTSHATEVDLEDLLRRALDATGEGARWSTDADEMWCRLTPLSATRQQQGWKLHVSATSASAPAVLAKALDVLLRDRSAFKFARSLEQVSALNSRATPRGSSGKFITVYPRSDTDAARIALELHQATAGLAGPRILSDQPYAVNSLVHYRYGAFVGRRRLSDEGLLVWFIEDPDGNPVEDIRTGQYSPPSWAVSPFPASVPAPPRTEEEAPGPVLLGGRFSVREAIRHTNKGGVYRGTDVTTGAPVVIKEARPHVEADASGCDVRDWLRAEARTLGNLTGTGLAPEPLAMFEHGGHLFLAQEEIPGVPLRNWVAEHFRDVGSERYRTDALAQTGRLVDLLAAAHACGCVLRDFTPANIMVRPDGELRLIDLELAVLKDDAALPTTVGTPGFSAPERLADAPVSPTADYYSLGATVCFVLAGKIPNLLPEEPATRSAEQRLAEWLAACERTLRLPDGLPEMILGLMKDDPAERWDPARARAALRRTARPLPAHPAAGPTGEDPGHDATAAAVAGIVEHLLDSMTPGTRGGCGPFPPWRGDRPLYRAAGRGRCPGGPDPVLRAHRRSAPAGNHLHRGPLDRGPDGHPLHAPRAALRRPGDRLGPVRRRPRRRRPHAHGPRARPGPGSAGADAQSRRHPRLRGQRTRRRPPVAPHRRPAPRRTRRRRGRPAGRRRPARAGRRELAGPCGSRLQGSRQTLPRLRPRNVRHRMFPPRRRSRHEPPGTPGPGPGGGGGAGGHGLDGRGDGPVAGAGGKRAHGPVLVPRFGGNRLLPDPAVADHRRRPVRRSRPQRRTRRRGAGVPRPLTQCHGLAGNGDFLLDMATATGIPPTARRPRTWPASSSPNGPTATATSSSPTSTGTSRRAGATDPRESWRSSCGPATQTPGTG